MPFTPTNDAHPESDGWRASKRRREKAAFIIAFLDTGPIPVEKVREFDEAHWTMAIQGANALPTCFRKFNHASDITRELIIKMMAERPRSARPKTRRK